MARTPMAPTTPMSTPTGTPMTTTPTSTNGPALVPVEQDSRLLDVTRRHAQASDLRDRATARRKALQRTRDDAHTPPVDRLEAERDLPGALGAERDAEITLLQLADEVTATRNAVRIEVDAALVPRIRTRALALQAALEGVQRGEHSALVAELETYHRLTGSA